MGGDVDSDSRNSRRMAKSTSHLVVFGTNFQFARYHGSNARRREVKTVYTTFNIRVF